MSGFATRPSPPVLVNRADEHVRVGPVREPRLSRVPFEPRLAALRGELQQRATSVSPAE